MTIKDVSMWDAIALLVAVSVCLIFLMLFSGCSTGIRYTYDNGVLTSKSPYLEFGQLQTKEDYASLDVLKGTGFDAKIPIPLASTAGFGTLDIALGYFSHVRMLIKPTAEGELPVIVIDSGVNPFNKSGVTDTVLTGKEAVKEFYLEEEREQ